MGLLKEKIQCQECKIVFRPFSASKKLFCSRECAFSNKDNRIKISNSLKGRSIPIEVRKKMNKDKIGKHRSEFTKKKISISRLKRKEKLGYLNSPETRKKMSEIAKRLGLGKSQKGKHWKMSLEGRKALSESHKGEKSHLWRGGITPINQKIRTSLEYKLWRTAIFIRDNRTCVLCGRSRKKGDRVIIHADHIKSFALYPELRFEMNNGRTLCFECHKKTDTYGVNVHIIKNKKKSEIKEYLPK